MTLVELLLVLVLLVVIGGLAAPTLTGSFASTRLRWAADEVVGAWTKARRLAIESGVVYQFRFQPDDNVYRVEPFTALDAAQLSGGGVTSTAASAAASSQTAANAAVPGSSAYGGASTTASSSPGATSPNATAQNEPIEQQEAEDQDLPDEVVFEDGQFVSADPLRSDGQVEQLNLRGQDWTRPILFYPDGTTSNASIVLKNSRDQFIRVTLRGLTGVGRASSVISKEDAAKPESRRQ